MVREDTTAAAVSGRAACVCERLFGSPTGALEGPSVFSFADKKIL